MKSAHKKYFLFLLPWHAWSFCEIFLPPDFFAGTAITAGKTAFALLPLLALYCLLRGLVGLFRTTSDKLVHAFAGTPVVFICGALLLFSVSSLSPDRGNAIFIAALAVPAAYVSAVCLLMLIRVLRARKTAAVPAGAAVIILFSLCWLCFVSDRATAAPEFLRSEFIERLFFFLLYCAAPIAALGFYLHYCVPEEKTPNGDDAASLPKNS